MDSNIYDSVSPSEALRAFLKYKKEEEGSMSLIECKCAIISMLGCDVKLKDLRSRIEYVRSTLDLPILQAPKPNISFEEFLCILKSYDRNIYPHTEFATFDSRNRGCACEKDFLNVMGSVAPIFTAKYGKLLFESMDAFSIKTVTFSQYQNAVLQTRSTNSTTDAEEKSVKPS